MASIRKRQSANGVFYEVQVRRVTAPYLCLSFRTQEQAVKWVQRNEENYARNPEVLLGYIQKCREEFANSGN